MNHATTPPPAIEIVRPDFPRGQLRAALFDFDGTLSLLRRNWQDVMIPMMVRVLRDTGTSESEQALFEVVEEFVMRLNGRQTIYQMMHLAEEVARRGGTPRDPLEYKHQYHDLLWQQVGERVASVRSGAIPAEEMRVPGSVELLQHLRDQGLTLYLASGTDLHYVRDEVALLGLDEFFGPHIYGALDDYQSFSKQMIIRRMIEETGMAGENIVGFGDGFVEIEEIKKVGGVAVGVASNEETRAGINAWKRDRLVRAGADLIVGDYRDRAALLSLLAIGAQ
jgi:phosphoglycolate phosphatase